MTDSTKKIVIACLPWAIQAGEGTFRSDLFLQIASTLKVQGFRNDVRKSVIGSLPVAHSIYLARQTGLALFR
jgi:hypothetical protein